MPRLIDLVIVLMLAGGGLFSAEAATLDFYNGGRLVVIDSREDLSKASSLASLYWDQKARILESENSRYAVVLGPLVTSNIASYSGANLPSDDYLATGNNFVVQIWSVAGSVGIGKAREDVRFVQRALTELNYDPGDADGLLGSRTRRAISRYQADWQLKETGQVTNELLERLRQEHPQTAPQWKFVEDGACKFWNPYPQARETASFDGACTEGKLTGWGTLTSRFVRMGRVVVSIDEIEFSAGEIVDVGAQSEQIGDRIDEAAGDI